VAPAGLLPCVARDPRWCKGGRIGVGFANGLTGELQHLPYRDVSDHLHRIDRYTSLAAADMKTRGYTEIGRNRSNTLLVRSSS